MHRQWIGYLCQSTRAQAQQIYCDCWRWTSAAFWTKKRRIQTNKMWSDVCDRKRANETAIFVSICLFLRSVLKILHTPVLPVLLALSFFKFIFYITCFVVYLVCALLFHKCHFSFQKTMHLSVPRNFTKRKFWLTLWSVSFPISIWLDSAAHCLKS